MSVTVRVAGTFSQGDGSIGIGCATWRGGGGCMWAIISIGSEAGANGQHKVTGKLSGSTSYTGQSCVCRWYRDGLISYSEWRQEWFGALCGWRELADQVLSNGTNRQGGYGGD